MKLSVFLLGLWLGGSPAFAAQLCCAEMPAPTVACDGCGGHSDSEPSPRPDCCTSLEAQKDVDAVVPRKDVPQDPVVLEFLTEAPGTSSWRPEAINLVAERAASLAEGPPLYLRYEVLLI